MYKILYIETRRQTKCEARDTCPDRFDQIYLLIEVGGDKFSEKTWGRKKERNKTK